ncbi:MAG: hypothetical protein ACJA2E_001304 [Arenicella sp.]|jgi:hypothetical protein
MITKAPWHLWLVGILALLWNSFGAIDYLMTQTQNAGYMASFSEQQLAYFYAQPLWMVCAWAVAIWSSVLASVLLLMRNKIAAPLFLISWIGLVVTCFHSYVLSNGYEIMGGNTALAFSALLFVIAGALFFYSRAMFDKGILA